MSIIKEIKKEVRSFAVTVILDDENIHGGNAFTKAKIMKASDCEFDANNTQYTKSEDFDWWKTKNGKGVVIENYLGKETEIKIPPQIDGLPVIDIKQLKSNTLTSVIFPDSITEIRTHMLGFCGAIKSITIGRGVKIIRAYAFEKKKFLTELVIPDNVVTIERGAFEDCALKKVTIGKSVKSIGKEAFRNNQLTEVIIPDNVTFIGEAAFNKNKLKSITIPKGITYICERTFSENSLTSVTLPDTLTTIDDGAFADNQITEIKIPDSVKYISREAFQNNKITSLVIPDNVTHLGANAFESNKIESLLIGKGLSKIDERTFNENMLTELVIPVNIKFISNGTDTGVHAFSKNRLISVTFPEGITVGYRSFLNNKLASVICPKNAVFTGPFDEVMKVNGPFDNGVQIIKL